MDSSAPKLVFSAPSRKPKEEHGLKKIIVFGFLGLVVGLVGYMTYKWFIYSTTHISTNDSYVEADIWPVNSHNVGYISEILVKENQEIKKGDLLIKLADRDLQIELKYKKARYQKGLADLKRARILSKSKMVPPSELETAEASVVALEADMEGTLLKLDFTKITSPVSGIVSRLEMHEGQFIQPGQTLMMVVAQDLTWIKANFKETQLARVKTGLSVDVEIDAYPGETWQGHIQNIYPASGSNMSLFPPENSTGNFTKVVQRIPVTILLENKKGFNLRPGMSAFSTIVLK